MNFVPAYTRDIFVSYARANNRPAIHGDPGSRWVSALVNTLAQRLPEALRPATDVSIFFDEKDVQENEPLGVQLENQVRQSAVLLVVCSKASADSAWCRREWEVFAGPTRAAVRAGRVFVVQIEDVERSEWQGAFLPDLLPIPFFAPATGTEESRRLGYPRVVPGEPDYAPYNKALSRLTAQIAAKLQDLRAGPPPSPTPTLPRVYVAEASPDLEDIREPLRTHLFQVGYEMVPRAAYPRAPAEFRAAVERDLRDALAFVQLNGRYVTPRTGDLPQGYEGLQLELARAAGLPVFRWRARDLNPATISDPEHRRACESDMDWVSDVPGLQEALLGELRRLRARSVLAVPAATRPRAYVGIVAPDSEPRADEVAKVLTRADVDNEILPESDALTDLDDDDAAAYDGLLLVYDRAEDSWVRRRSQEFRNLLMRLEKNPLRRPPVFGFYRYVPPRRLPVQIREFQVVDGGPDGSLKPFIDRVLDHRGNEVTR